MFGVGRLDLFNLLCLLLVVTVVVDEHSVGFNTVRKTEKGNYNELVELKLWEGSTVTWGANEMAGTTAVKSMSKEDAVKKMDNVLKALRNGKYENEEVFDLLDIYFKQLQQIILDNSEQSTTPSNTDTLPDEIDTVLTNFINNI